MIDRAKLAAQFERDPDEPIIPGLMTAHHILTTDWPEPIWAIPEYLPAGLTIIAGKPKIGKSWLALQIACAVSSGGRTLGKDVEQGSALYLALEDPPRRLKDRMKKQRWPDNPTCDFLALGDFNESIGDLKNGGGLKLAQQIQQKRYKYVCIDTLSRAIVGDQNEVEEMTAALTPLQEMAHSENCAVVIVDHHRKSIMDQDAVTNILGSTAKGAMADCVWGLYRERGKLNANLAITGRDVVEITLAVTMDWELGCWQSDGDADEIQRGERKDEIVAFIESNGAAGLIEIAEATDRDKSNVFRDLNELINANLIKKTGLGRGKVKYCLSDNPLL